MVSAVLRLLWAGLAAVALVAPAHAYIGPGAGFAAAGSVLVLLGTFLLAFAIILIWPFKAAIRMVTAPRRGKSKVKRVVIVSDNDEPGQRGADKLQAAMGVSSVVLVPPAKDIREAYQNGFTGKMLLNATRDLVWGKPC